MLKVYDTLKIVILDKDKIRRELLKSMMVELGYLPICFDNETICCENLEVIAPDAIFCTLDSIEGIFRKIYAIKLVDPYMPVVLLADYAGFFKDIKQAFKEKVACLSLPVGVDDIRECLGSLSKQETGQFDSEFCPLVGISREIANIRKQVDELSDVNSSIFIIGEKGSGRELIARTIFENNGKDKGNFVKFDSAQFERSNEYDDNKAMKNLLCLDAYIEDKQKVTILVTEIEKLPVQYQGHLLLLVDKAENNNGSGYGKNVNFIVTACDRITNLVETNLFRKDLYFRLNVIKVDVPPLRNRRTDIDLLTDYFTFKYCLEFQRSFFRISSKAKSVFRRYNWPGNVAELENTIKRIVSTGDERFVLEAPPYAEAAKSGKTIDIINFFPGTSRLVARLKEMIDKGNDFSLRGVCEDFAQITERRLIKIALDQTNWNRKKAASLLKISYKSMLNKIKEYNLA